MLKKVPRVQISTKLTEIKKHENPVIRKIKKEVLKPILLNNFYIKELKKIYMCSNLNQNSAVKVAESMFYIRAQFGITGLILLSVM